MEIWDHFNVPDSYKNEYKGIVVLVEELEYAKIKYKFLLDDSVSALYSNARCEIGDSVYKAPDSYDEQYFRKNDFGKYIRLKRIENDEGDELYVFYYESE
jgi:hypothetical protein